MRVLHGLGIALFLAGLLAGIFYPLSIVLWSGEPHAAVTRLEGQDVFRGRVVLDPSMNPVRATFKTSYAQPSVLSEVFATVTLRGPDGLTVWTRRLRVHSRGESGTGWTSSSMPVQRFEVSESGAYEAEVRLEQRRGGSFRDASVEFRRNVKAIDWMVVAGLAGIAVLGLGLSLGVDFLRDLLGLGRDVRDAAREVRDAARDATRR